MRLLRGIAVIVGCLLILALAGHFYLVRQVETQLERIASRLSLTGRLTWNRILVHPSGKLIISDLRFEPREARDLLLIDVITFRSSDLAQLVLALQSLERHQLPRGMNVSMRNARLPVGPPFSDWLNGRFLPILPHAGAGCDFDQQRLTDLNRLDYWELGIDAQLRYQIVVEGEQLDLEVRLAVRQLADWRARMRLALEEPLSSIHALAPTLAASNLLTAEMELNDLGFHERLHGYCAQSLELSRERWLQQHIDAWRRSWAAQGLAPDDIAESAYRTFLDQPGTLSLDKRGDPPLALASLDELSIMAALPAMEIFLRVNESAPVPLRLSRIVPTMPAAPTEPALPATAQGPAVQESRIPTHLIDPTTQALPPVVPPGWRSVPLDSAELLINQSVRLLLDNETRASGRLIAVDEQSLYLEIRSRHGLLTRPFARARIAELYVPDSD